MNFRTAAVLATAISTLALAGCASSSDPDVVEQATDGPAKATSSSSTKPSGQLVASGFGQQDEYVWVTSLVRNTSPHVGQTVTVQFNILDAHNKIIGSDSQVESFSQPDQLLVVGTQIDVKSNEKAAKVKATLLIEDEGTFSTKPFPRIPTSPVHISKGEYGNTTGTFEVSNPTTAPLKDARVGVICYDAKHNVVGGSSEYPDLVPPSGKIRVESTLNTLRAPAKCDAYAGPGL
uniref:Lipoprotein n=1 Tax=Streptomyces sp. NBC_01393 TaxID=2903851 RepID=A0AAU3HS20_9ACTN